MLYSLPKDPKLKFENEEIYSELVIVTCRKTYVTEIILDSLYSFIIILVCNFFK